ncbi:YciI family protein [Arthrobacter sp. UYEF3]|uniref:YciI family protein n=1 Tax=Arthrobacter sp. UYEF3 TaxID=1756365 RepID=UPI00339B257A
MAQYLLSVYQPVGPAPAPDVLEPIMQDLDVLDRDMKAAGVWVFAAGLDPTSSATVVRQQGTEVLITDGPFAEAKEHLGGFTVIDAPDLDAALGWAGRLARATTLSIEVRPIQH